MSAIARPAAAAEPPPPPPQRPEGPRGRPGAARLRATGGRAAGRRRGEEQGNRERPRGAAGTAGEPPTQPGREAGGPRRTRREQEEERGGKAPGGRSGTEARSGPGMAAAAGPPSWGEAGAGAGRGEQPGGLASDRRSLWKGLLGTDFNKSRDRLWGCTGVL